MALGRKKRCKTTGKKRYPSKLDAVTAAGSITRRKFKSARPYFCTHCGHWHLTTMSFAKGGRRS